MLIRITLGLALVLSTSRIASADVFTWTGPTGGDANWSTASNWSGGNPYPPSLLPDLHFVGTPPATTIMDQSITVNSVAYMGGVSSIVNSGGAQLFLGNSATAGSGFITVTNSTPVTLSAPVVLNGAAASTHNFTVEASNALTVSGTITSTAGAGLTSNGAGQLQLNSTLSGSFSLNQTGSGLTILAGSNAGYSGLISISAGTLRITNASALGTNASGVAISGTGSLDFANTTAVATAFNLNSAAGLGSGVGAVTNSGTVGVLHTGAIAITGSGTFGGNSSGAITLAGALSGSGQFTKVGSGTVVLSGSNAGYTGAVQVSAGVLRLGTAGGLGSASGVTVAAGATLDLNGLTATATAPLSLSDNGSGAGALYNSSTTTSAQYGGAVTLNSADVRVGSQSLWEVALSGPVGGSGGFRVLGTSRLRLLNSSNTYAGPTTVANGGILWVGNGTVNGSLPGNVTLEGSGSSVRFAPSTAVTVNGTISGAGGILVNSGIVVLNGATSAATVSIAANSTLVLGPSGSIQNNITVPSNAVFNVNGVTGGANGTGPGGTYAQPANTTLTTYSGGTVAGPVEIGGTARIGPQGSLNSDVGTFGHTGGSMTWAPGGVYTYHYLRQSVPNATLVPGTSSDLILSDGTLNVTATNGDRFNINIQIGSGLNTFAPAPQTVVIATFSSAPTFTGGNFNDLFTITGDFANGTTPVVSIQGNNVLLNFTPVPEPSTVLGLSSLGFAFMAAVRKRWRRSE